MTPKRNPLQPLVLLTTAHAAMLGSQGLIDEAAVEILAGVVERVGEASVDPLPPVELIADFDARVDGQSPPGFAGASRVGRGVNELVAAYVRVVLREELLDLDDRLSQLREDVIDLAVQHVVTIMPAYQQGLAAQPTTLAHLLGGVLGPLDRSHLKLDRAFELVNQSPLGAGAMVSTGIPIDRQELARNAGFDAVIENTFDAVAAVDHIAATAEAIRSVVTPVERFVREIELLFRTDPQSLLMHDATPTVRSELPQLATIPAFDELERLYNEIESTLGAIDRVLAGAPLEPVPAMGQLLARFMDLLDATAAYLERFRILVNREIAFNRAYLANRANRNHSTVGELADYLMLEEQVPPAEARSMASHVTAQLREEGLETSGITSAMIDSAGLLVLGRELGVEFESLSKYLAPRRFIERRAGLGGPAPQATREWLTRERALLESDRKATARRRASLAEATTSMAAIGDPSSG